MKINATRRVSLICGIAISALLAAVAVGFIISDLLIYNADPLGDPYSPKAISEKFVYIAAPVFLLIAAVIATGILSLIFRLEVKKPKAEEDVMRDLSRMRSRTNLAAADESERAAIHAERKRRRILFWSLIGSTVLFSVLAFILVIIQLYAVAEQTDPKAGVGASALIILACSVPPVTLAVLNIILGRASARREYELLRAVSRREGGAVKPAPRPDECPRVNLILRSVVLVAAVTLIIVGVAFGGAGQLLENAITLCKSCVGIG